MPSPVSVEDDRNIAGPNARRRGRRKDVGYVRWAMCLLDDEKLHPLNARRAPRKESGLATVQFC